MPLVPEGVLDSLGDSAVKAVRALLVVCAGGAGSSCHSSKAVMAACSGLWGFHCSKQSRQQVPYKQCSDMHNATHCIWPTTFLCPWLSESACHYVCADMLLNCCGCPCTHPVQALCLACGSDPDKGTAKKMGAYVMKTCFQTTTVSRCVMCPLWFSRTASTCLNLLWEILPSHDISYFGYVQVQQRNVHMAFSGAPAS